MRKNFSKEFSKRPWKTPSPSSQNELKSPRYNPTNRPPLLRLQSKFTKQDSQKNKPTLLSFKNQLIELKQQANKLTAGPHINSGAHGGVGTNLNTNHHEEYPSEYKISNEELDSYNAYFSKASSVYSSIIKNTSNSCKNIKNARETREARGSGFKTEDSEPGSSGLAQSSSKYEQKLKKYVEHIGKIKSNYKELQASYQKLVENNKKVEGELELTRIQVAALRKKLEQKKYREGTLNQEIKNLKQLLEINTNELNGANFQIYKMKQQLYQLSIQKQKPQNSPSQKPEQKPCQQPCQLCRANQPLILSLNNALQTKMFQLGKKDQAIQALCADLQKLQSELKMFEKPKILVRRIAFALEIANQIIMVGKLKALEKRLERAGEQG